MRAPRVVGFGRCLTRSFDGAFCAAPVDGSRRRTLMASSREARSRPVTCAPLGMPWNLDAYTPGGEPLSRLSLASSMSSGCGRRGAGRSGDVEDLGEPNGGSAGRSDAVIIASLAASPVSLPRSVARLLRYLVPMPARHEVSRWTRGMPPSAACQRRIFASPSHQPTISPDASSAPRIAAEGHPAFHSVTESNRKRPGAVKSARILRRHGIYAA